MNRRRTAGKSKWVCVAALFCGVAIGAPPDPPWNVTRIGQMGGWCHSVSATGHYAYLGEGHNLTILDVSDLSSPVMVAHLNFGDFEIHHIQILGNLAYLAGAARLVEHGLRILDISNPPSPRLLSSYPTPAVAQCVYVTDGLAYVALATNTDYYDQRGGFQIIDVSDASSPTLVGSFLSTPFYGFGVHVTDGIAYVAASDGLHIFDVTNPSVPRHLSRYDFYAGCYDVFVSGGLAYAVVDSGLGILDVTSPTAPAFHGGIGTSSARALSYSDGLVFVAQQDNGVGYPNGLAIIDATTPSSPTKLAVVTMPGQAMNVFVSSNTAYVANWWGGLSIVDVADPSSPTLHATYDTLSDAKDVYVADDVAYVADGVRGLKTVDVSNPRSPRILGSLGTPGGATKVSVCETKAYVSGFAEYRGGPWFFQVVDVTTPSSPRSLGTYHDVRPYDSAVAGGLAYIADWQFGLRIVDVTEPSSPTLLGSLETPSWAEGVAVSGDLAFIADYTSLQIIDVSNPARPALRSSFPGSRVTHVCASNGVAYITGEWSDGDFACVDVTDPDNARLLGKYNMPELSGLSKGLYVSDGRAYFIRDHLRILDVSDPAHPILCGFYPTSYTLFGSDVFARGAMVYLADWTGLRIFQFTGGDAVAEGCWRLYK